MHAAIATQHNLVESWYQADLVDFFASVSQAGESALFLDFDGTLVPFRIDGTKVRPWAGVRELLSQMQERAGTRLVIITGRPADEISTHLPLREPLEIWGLHGAERLLPSGRLEMQALTARQEDVFGAARDAIHKLGLSLGMRVEQKANAVGIHWRGKSAAAVQEVRQAANRLLSPYAEVEGITLLHFDGGMELRAGRNKGDAVRLLLEELPQNAPVAYLGDDATDEDAFRALANRGLAVLVRRELRPTAAHLWLKPPEQLREFLKAWIKAQR